MSYDRKTHGWAGSIRQLLDTPKSLVEDALIDHLSSLFGHGASNSQIGAWSEELDVLKQSFRNLAISRQDCLAWSIILEYELPLEGGRRPDVLILGPNAIFVLEFKQDPSLHRAALDQAAAYARDLSEYHSKSHQYPVIPILVPTKREKVSEVRDNVLILSPDQIAPHFDAIEGGYEIELSDWLEGQYAPLPTLIAAAKMIFNNERLPAIKRAQSLGVGKAVLALKEISDKSKSNNDRALAFVSGVPGAGKTLVGLQFVYEHSNEKGNAIFLSGNGPLVEVLRDALKSSTFVKDLHAYIKSYGLTSKVPSQHIVVFDEAQRAWDAEHMNVKNSVPFSEPELLIGIGEKIPNWATLVGLIGHGQEINSGEEAGITGWNDALNSNSAKSDWKIYSPPRFSANFPNHSVEIIPELDLTKTLRSRQAEDLHNWVEAVLNGNLREAAISADRIWMQNYQIFVTRSLEQAREYIRNRYLNQETMRYGILASSKDKILPQFGLHNDFQSTKRVKNAAWYNKGVGEEGSCCNLVEVVTEFACQGLELDMALVAWGNDFLWNGASWELKKMRPKYTQHDPHQLRLNSYRVLLTRSRDGVTIFIPPLPEFDQTEHALLAAGAKILMDELPISKIG